MRLALAANVPMICKERFMPIMISTPVELARQPRPRIWPPGQDGTLAPPLRNASSKRKTPAASAGGIGRSGANMVFELMTIGTPCALDLENQTVAELSYGMATTP